MTTTGYAVHRGGGVRAAPTGRFVAVVDCVAFGVLITTAGLSFGPAYGGARWLVAVSVGAVAGLVAGVLPAVLRWPAVTTVALAIVGYGVLGPAVATPQIASAGFLPNLESLRLLALGVVSGWKQLLTVADPVGSAGGLLIAAMLTGLVAGAVAGMVVARTRRPLWALVAPATVFVTAALFGTQQANRPVLTGVVCGVVALLWGSWRTGGFGSAGIDLRRPVSLMAVVVAAIAAGVFVPPLAAPATMRTALRETVTPPFDVRDYPSPLSAFRRYVKAEATTPLITVSGLPRDGRIRLATMDAYNGLIYQVSDDAGAFRPVGGVVRSDVVGDEVTLDVTVDSYSGVWLPDIGAMSSLSFSGSRENDLATDVRYSSATGTGVVPGGLREGDHYRVTGIVPAVPGEATLEKAGIGSASLGDTSRVPSSLASAASTIVKGYESEYDKVEAIRSTLATRGMLSHGDTLSSPAGHGYDRLVRLLNDKKMVGDQEQFAPTMALMVQSLGIPARVVLGFAPADYDGAGPVTLTGSDVSAWVEVNFDSVGWVAFSPTPDESQVQQQTSPEQDAAPQRQNVQPPPPPRHARDVDAADVDDSDSDDADDDDKDDEKQEEVAGGRGRWLLAAGVGVPALLLLGLASGIVLLKDRRRRRYRRGTPTSRVAGAWEQLLDGAVDLGADVSAAWTRRETAYSLGQRFGTDSTMRLADAADQGVFGPGEAAGDEADRYWGAVDQGLAEMRRTVSPWRRFRARLSTLSLRRRRL